MALAVKVLFVIVSIIFGFVYQTHKYMIKPFKVPELDYNTYWGPGDSKNFRQDTSIRPFSISYSDNIIADLQKQLKQSPQFHAPLEDVGFEYGFNSNELKRIIKYWADDYLNKWDERQDYLNKYPQFKTNIQGLDIHFIHIKNGSEKKSENVIPILLIHGWPGSVVEFYDFIEKLTNKKDKDFIFDIVVPSLPGYGWSQGASKTGLGAIEISIIFNNLMQRLGYGKYFIQGGDWGSMIGSSMATLFQENVLGFHSNLCAVNSPLSITKTFIASLYPTYFIDEKYVDWIFPLSSHFKYMLEESGYLHIQASKPDTIGIALTSNPKGLIAYILEKFSTWTNYNFKKLKDGGLEKHFSLDVLLDNIMVYYLSNSITTSVRLYSESMTIRHLGLNMDRVPTVVPVGCARFKFDIFHHLDWVLKDKYLNLIHSTYHDDGGHFAAMQLPNVLYQDVMVFINKVRNQAQN